MGKDGDCYWSIKLVLLSAYLQHVSNVLYFFTFSFVFMILSNLTCCDVDMTTHIGFFSGFEQSYFNVGIMTPHIDIFVRI